MSAATPKKHVSARITQVTTAIIFTLTFDLSRTAAYIATPVMYREVAV